MENNKQTYSFEELIPIIEASIIDNGVFPLTVTGSSMTPTLYGNRDIVHLVSPNYKAPEKYDIVLFKRTNGRIVLHRIIKELPDNRFLINGDCQNWTEEITASQIIAVTKSYNRNGKTISCNTTVFKLKSALWCSTRKIRPLLFKASSLLKRKK